MLLRLSRPTDVTNLVLWREKIIKNSFEKREGEKITFTPIFIEAVVRAIKDMPMINIQVNGTQIIKKKDINISHGYDVAKRQHSHYDWSRGQTGGSDRPMPKPFNDLANAPVPMAKNPMMFRAGHLP